MRGRLVIMMGSYAFPGQHIALLTGSTSSSTDIDIVKGLAITYVPPFDQYVCCHCVSSAANGTGSSIHKQISMGVYGWERGIPPPIGTSGTSSDLV